MEALLTAAFGSFISAIVLSIIIRSAVVKGIKQAFKEMEAEKLQNTESPQVKPIRTDRTLITKSGTVFERKT